MYMVQRRRSVEVPISDAKAQLTDLVRRAEAGDEVILTRRGSPAARIVPIKAKPTREQKRALLEALRDHGRQHPSPGPSAAYAADFLYDDDGRAG